MPSKILVLGDYSGNNAGHNALLFSIVKGLESTVDAQFIIPTLKPKLLRRLFANEERNIAIVGVAPWNVSIKFMGIPVFKAIKQVDCILLTDNLFYDTGFYNLLKNNLIALVLITLIAKMFSKPLIYYNSGVGPVRSAPGRMCIRWISSRLDMIILRDEDSAALLKQISPDTDYLLSADAGFDLARYVNEDNKMRLIGLERQIAKRKWIGINMSYHLINDIKRKGLAGLDLKEAIYHIAMVFKEICKQYDYSLVFFITHPKDCGITGEIISELEDTIDIIVLDQSKYHILDMTYIASKLQCIIGTRYHELVSFASVGTPVIGIECGDKMSSLFQLLGIPECLLHVSKLFENNADEHVSLLIDNVERKIDLYKDNVKFLREKACMGRDAFIERFCSKWSCS